jgi:hypothetical protein
MVTGTGKKQLAITTSAIRAFLRGKDGKKEILKFNPFSKGAPKVSNEENSIGIETGSCSKASETELDNASISHGPSSTAMANQTIQPVSHSIVSCQDPGRVEGIQVNREADLTEDDQRNRNENGKILPGSLIHET